jgi:hypothetical protein
MGLRRETLVPSHWLLQSLLSPLVGPPSFLLPCVNSADISGADSLASGRTVGDLWAQEVPH